MQRQRPTSLNEWAARFPALFELPASGRGGAGQGDAERLATRRKLSQSEKVLSGLIYERVESELGFSRIRRKGDQALFDGATTRAMKKQLGVPKGRALADFLPTVILKAKNVANKITNFNVKRSYLHTEAQITREHVKNNRAVRRLLKKGRITPEKLPPAEDVKKIERRAANEQRQLTGRASRPGGRSASSGTAAENPVV
jgi:DNA-damage-inducible protein D